MSDNVTRKLIASHLVEGTLDAEAAGAGSLETLRSSSLRFEPLQDTV